MLLCVTIFVIHKQCLIRAHCSIVTVVPYAYRTKKNQLRLGSVAGPVIQATGKSTFEDGLRSGGSGSDFT
jgi:hypothetical protein